MQIVKAADKFMVRWDRVEVEHSRIRHANEDGKKKGHMGKGGGEEGSRTGTAVAKTR